MKQANDFAKFFREQAQLLQETPSPEAWMRVEQHLDRYAKRRRNIGIVRIAAIAAILAGIGLSNGFLQFKNGQNSSQGNFRLETLNVAEDYPQASMAIKFQKNLTAQAQEIQEGTPGKKFR